MKTEVIKSMPQDSCKMLLRARGKRRCSWLRCCPGGPTPAPEAQWAADLALAPLHSLEKESEERRCHACIWRQVILWDQKPQRRDRGEQNPSWSEAPAKLNQLSSEYSRQSCQLDSESEKKVSE